MASSETCSRCGQEVRWGWRAGVEGYLHREPVDHVAIFGHIQTDEDRAEIERGLDEPRTRTVTKTRKVKGEKIVTTTEEIYTARGADHDRYVKNAKFREAEELEAADLERREATIGSVDDDLEDEGHDDIEPIEVYATPIERSDPRCRQGVRNLMNAAGKAGWGVLKLTYARGPYLGANGKSLGVSDSVRLIVRGPDVDGEPLLGVASWRDGKSDTVWLVENGKMTKSGAKLLTAKMKEVPHGAIT